MNKDLGFQGLSRIKPDTAEAKKDKPAIPDAKIDKIGDRHGFKSREPIQKIVRRKQAEPTANLNIRPPVEVYNRFVQYAIDNRLSYPEALVELLDKAGVK